MWFSVALLCCLSCALAQELFQNGDMENLASWKCRRIKCTMTDVHHSGNSAIEVSERTRWHKGVEQKITVEPGKMYSMSFWVKLLNDGPAQLGQGFNILVKIKFTDNSKQNFRIAYNRRVRVVDGWIEMKGDMTVPNKLIKSTTVCINGPAPGMDFIVDNASAQEIPEWTTWREDTDNSIKELRTNSININVTAGDDIDQDEVEISITQLKKSFPFGTAINCDLYHHGDERYSDFIHQHFNWVTIENGLKWNLMEKKPGQINYKRPMDALKKLQQNGMKVRAHTILWSPITKVPTWVQPMWNDTLKNVTNNHIVDIVTRTRDYVEHWDVNNENLHGFFYQDHVYDFDYNLDVFRLAHETGPNVKMFLNDYAVVNHGMSTAAYRLQAEQFKHANVGLYGMGVQSHLGEQEINPTIIKYRLDTLAEAGVPIWITEMDVTNSDENIRADKYEKALRVLYAHPAVEGIILWGFWSEKHFRGEIGSLVSGQEFRINAAGQRVLDLFENQWMTNQTRKLSESGKQFTVDGFHGDYEVRVSYKGQELVDQKKTFTLGGSPHSISLSVE